jgi:LuxR family transcriptional regulator, maltose regulon positive regulatory protein
MQSEAHGNPGHSDSASGPLVTDGWRYLEEGRWQEARDAFLDAAAVEPAPEVSEGLSWAAWWLDDADRVFPARERAFRGYREADRPVAAARMALWLSVDHLDFRGARAVAQGWLARAGRLLEDHHPVPEHGWASFIHGYLAHASGEVERAEERARETVDVGRRLGVPDLEMLGIGLLGSVRVSRGELKEGTRLLDEAGAMAVSGEGTLPISGAWTCCFLVWACREAHDYPRALEWCREIESFARRHGSRYMLGFCRTHFGSIYMAGGRWEEAEAALEQAVEAYAASRPAFLPDALVPLAELRRRQGRTEEAEKLLARLGPGEGASVCLARLALDRGDAPRAVELARSRLRRIPRNRRPGRTEAVELLVHAHAEAGEPDRAREALDQLKAILKAYPSTFLEAQVAFGSGVLAAARGDGGTALPHLEEARARFRDCGAPYEAIRAGLEEARALTALDRLQGARRAARTALDAAEELGARREKARAEDLLRELAPGARGPAPLPELTAREREVLCEVAQGLTNREVAARLHISEHTVHRHVANILRKLGVPSRAAAAARAASAGLLDPGAG